MNRAWAGVGTVYNGIDSARADSGSSGGAGCCAAAEPAITQSSRARPRITCYTPTMTVPATSRQTRAFEDRADALAHFFLRAGEAPRLVAYDDAAGCPLDQGLAAIEWTAAVGILAEGDLIHAARLGPDAAAAVIERKEGDQRVYMYFGPRMDAPPADPYEGTLLYDQPGVPSYGSAGGAASRGPKKKRESTRLNSRHTPRSYGGLWLKKKKESTGLN